MGVQPVPHQHDRRPDELVDAVDQRRDTKSRSATRLAGSSRVTRRAGVERRATNSSSMSVLGVGVKCEEAGDRAGPTSADSRAARQQGPVDMPERRGGLPVQRLVYGVAEEAAPGPQARDGLSEG
jgi:hypothetical protein